MHQTVRDFYTRIDTCPTDDDCVCSKSPHLLALQRDNAKFLSQCDALPVLALKDMMVQVRGLTFLICKIGGLLIDIALNMVLTFSSKNKEVASSKILLDWADLKKDAASILDKTSDIFFDMMFASGVLGPWLKNNIMSACNLLSWAYDYAANIWCGLIVQQLPVFLAALRSIGGDRKSTRLNSVTQ